MHDIMCLIPESGRSPGVGHGNPPQDTFLENPIERCCQATVHRVTKSRTWLKQLSKHAHTSCYAIIKQSIKHCFMTMKSQTMKFSIIGRIAFQWIFCFLWKQSSKPPVSFHCHRCPKVRTWTLERRGNCNPIPLKQNIYRLAPAAQKLAKRWRKIT